MARGGSLAQSPNPISNIEVMIIDYKILLIQVSIHVDLFRQETR